MIYKHDRDVCGYVRVCETLQLFKCGDEFLFIHMENRVNAETPRVKFKNSAEERQKGGERGI